MTPRTTTPWQRSKDRYLDRSQSNKYAINMQIQTISVSKKIDGTIMKHNQSTWATKIPPKIRVEVNSY